MYGGIIRRYDVEFIKKHKQEERAEHAWGELTHLRDCGFVSIGLGIRVTGSSSRPRSRRRKFEFSATFFVFEE